MEAVQALDIQLLYWIAQYVRNDLLTPILTLLTHLCDHGELWLTLALLLLLRPRTRRCGAAVLLAMALGLVLGNGLLKHLLARPRPFTTYPDLIPLVQIGGYSCPSGHSLSSFTAATAIFCFYKKPGAAALLLAALIGFTRLYVGVHYLTDVLFGAVIGIILGLLSAMAVKRIAANLHYARLKRADIPEKKNP